MVTDADRQDMRDAVEERQVLYEVVDEYVPTRSIMAKERVERIARLR